MTTTTTTTTEELPRTPHPKHRFKGEMTGERRDRINRIRLWCEEMLGIYGFVDVTHVQRVFSLPRTAARKDFELAMEITMSRFDRNGPVLSRGGTAAFKKLPPFVYRKPAKPPQAFTPTKMPKLS
jgi:hypothetical protein